MDRRSKGILDTFGHRYFTTGYTTTCRSISAEIAGFAKIAEIVEIAGRRSLQILFI
jgi:hypothetical protein